MRGQIVTDAQGRQYLWDEFFANTPMTAEVEQVLILDPPPVGYIETLERTVLKTWERIAPLEVRCRVCWSKFREREHSPDCIVPTLLEKYADA